MSEPSNFFEDNRALFDELDEVTKAASAAMRAGDMQAWVEAAGRGAEIHDQLAKLREAPSQETKTRKLLRALTQEAVEAGDYDLPAASEETENLHG